MNYNEIIKELHSLSNPDDVKGMASFGINSQKVYGVIMPEQRRIARNAGTEHLMAKQPLSTGYQETMILACMIEDPIVVTEDQMDAWALKSDT